MYKIGMLLYGSNRTVGNVWLVYDDGTTGQLGFNMLPKIALLWDGRNKLFCNDFKTTKHDVIKTGSLLREVDPADVALNTQTAIANFPAWAQSYLGSYTYKPIGSKSAAVNLPQGVLNKVNKALGIDDKALTIPTKSGKVVNTARPCPSHSNGEHEYKAYTGLIEHYEYCIHCDDKRRILS